MTNGAYMYAAAGILVADSVRAGDLASGRPRGWTDKQASGQASKRRGGWADQGTAIEPGGPAAKQAACDAGATAHLVHN